MINVYVGGVSYDLAAHHAPPESEATALRDTYVPRWQAGGLTGAVLQVADWASVNVLFAELARSRDTLTLCTDRASYEGRPDGTFGVFLSLEGHAGLAGDLEALYTLAHLGVTTFTFSHNRQNLLCTGSNEPYEGGFTYLGKQTLRRLEELPMMVDLVHMSRASFWDALRYYDGPLFVSHSNAHAVCPHPRNLTDEQIKAVAERGGVVGLNTFRGYVAQDPMRATLSDLLDHALHLYDLVGPEHMAVGADYCESPVDMLVPVLDWVDPEGAHGIRGRARELYEHGPTGIEDASRLHRLAEGLAERGLRPDEVALVCGESYLRMADRALPARS